MRRRALSCSYLRHLFKVKVKGPYYQYWNRQVEYPDICPGPFDNTVAGFRPFAQPTQYNLQPPDCWISMHQSYQMRDAVFRGLEGLLDSFVAYGLFQADGEWKESVVTYTRVKPGHPGYKKETTNRQCQRSIEPSIGCCILACCPERAVHQVPAAGIKRIFITKLQSGRVEEVF